MNLPSRPLSLTPPEDGTALVRLLDGVDYLTALATLHGRRGAQRYLEIGVAEGNTLCLARGTAIGIDPHFVIKERVWQHKSALHLFAEPSDAFFAERDPQALLGGPIDLAFIDGMHHAEYALRDFLNVEAHMAPGGAILLHDILPWSFDATYRLAREGNGYAAVVGGWTGDVWKVVALLQRERPDLSVTVLDCPPTGIALVTRLDPASTTLRDRYPALEIEAIEAMAGEAAFRTWLSTQRVADSRAWVAAGCPI